MPSNLLPMDARIYLQTLFGNREPISARDFNASELAAMREAVLRNQQRTGATARGNVGYEDYPRPEQMGPGYEPVKTTLGRFNYRVAPDGALRLLDRYDFLNDERRPNVEYYEAMSPVRRGVEAPLQALFKLFTRGPHSFAGELGDAFIGREGRPVSIDIPAPVNKARGGLAMMKECSCG